MPCAGGQLGHAARICPLSLLTSARYARSNDRQGAASVHEPWSDPVGATESAGCAAGLRGFGADWAPTEPQPIAATAAIAKKPRTAVRRMTVRTLARLDRTGVRRR